MTADADGPLLHSVRRLLLMLRGGGEIALWQVAERVGAATVAEHMIRQAMLAGLVEPVGDGAGWTLTEAGREAARLCSHRRP